METIKHLLDEQEAAQFLRLAPMTLRRWRSIGRGPRFIKLGASHQSAVRYRMSDLTDWIESRVRDTEEAACRK
jgi:predicted DNA-binding transcriptional regulator AlpA